MVIAPEQIETSSGAGVRFAAEFPTPARPDRKVEIQLRRDGTASWENFSVKTEDGVGASGVISDGSVHELRWRVVALSGRSSGYSAIREITAVADTTPPGALVDVTADVGGTTISLTWKAPNSANFAGVRVFRNTVDDTETATLIQTEYHAPNSTDGYDDTGLAPGSYFYWLLPINGSAFPGPATPTGELVVI